MTDYIEEACEDIDAAFFTGDQFHSREAIEEIEYYIGRWTREIKAIEKMLDAQEIENATTPDPNIEGSDGAV